MKLVSGKLPKGFVLAKPIAQENYDEAVIYELERQGRLVIERKRDGWKMFAVVDSNNKVRLFTDGLNEIDSRFNHIKRDLEKLRLPSGLVLVGEAILDIDDSDNIGKVISVFHSSTEKSIQFQQSNGFASFMIFGAILPGKVLANVPCSQIYSAILLMLSVPDPPVSVFVAPVLKLSFDEAKKIVVEKDWEGLVLYDSEYILTYRTDGKDPKRPKGCYKWKPILEDDFIVRARIFRPGTEVLKELVLSQADPVTGQEFYCGKLGSFTNQMRTDLSTIRLPIVVQVRFDMRFPKTGKIRNPRFMRVRDDKAVQACISPKTYPESEGK